MDERSDRYLSSRPQAIERRRSPRIEVLGRLEGTLVALDVPIVVQDLSLGGMAVETPFPFDHDSLHEFQLELGDGSWVILQARARHSRSLAGPDGTPSYVTGFEFVDPEPSDDSATVADLIEKIERPDE